MALALFLAGVVAGAAALVWGTVYGLDSMALFLLLLAGSLVAGAALAARPFLRTPRGRAALRTLAAAFLFSVVAILFGALNHRHVAKRWDWTRSRKYTLSATTKMRLRTLPRPVTLTLVLSPEPMPFGGTELNEELKDLVAQYEQAGRGRVRVRVWDFVEEHPRLLGYVRRLGLEPEDLYFPVLIAEAGAALRLLNAWDFVETGGGEARFRGEEELTQALEEVASPVRPRVYATRGHGEGDLDLHELPGFSQVRTALEGENLEVRSLSLEQRGAVPADARVLLVLGPRRDFTAREMEALQAYWRRGGRVLLCLDSGLEVAAEPQRLLRWVAHLGLDASAGVILDPEANFREMPDHLWVDTYGEHPLTAVLEGSPCVFPAARAVRIRAAAGTGSFWPLASSSRTSWLETDLVALSRGEAVERDPDEPGGPLPVAVALARDPSRLVVFGDVSWLRNATLRRLPGIVTATHHRLLQNVVNWLLERQRRLGIPPRRYGHPRLTELELPERRLRLLQWVSVLTGPALMALLGFGLWLWRRR